MLRLGTPSYELPATSYVSSDSHAEVRLEPNEWRY
jgi:hypothetical protein